MKILQNILRYTLLAFLATVGLLVLFGSLLSVVESAALTKLYSVFGWTGVVITGLVGTPIHELGHYLMCILFGLQVNEVSLFRPISGQSDGVLGFVNYSYHKDSIRELLGCFFAGIAPMIFSALVILLVIRLLTPEIWFGTSKKLERQLRKTNNPLKLMGTMIGSYVAGFFSLRKFGIIRGLVSLYLILSISMHMDLSLADVHGALPGVLVVAALCLVYAIIGVIAGWNIRQQLAKTAAVLTLFFSVGILLCAYSWAVASLAELAAAYI